MAADLGEAFARAFAAKDYDRIREVLAPEIDFRGMTPNRFWEATGPDAIVDTVLQVWLEDDENVQEIQEIESGEVGDRRRVRYRFRVQTPDGPQVVEQQAYYEVADDRISWMRVSCSGFRPI